MGEDPQPELPVILYIASASRSGSTLVDLTLGSLPGIVSVGEMRRLGEFAVKDRTVQQSLEHDNIFDCTCGRPVSSCEFWRRSENAAGFSFSEESFSSHAGTWLRWTLQAVFLLLGGRVLRSLSKIIPPFAHELQIADKCLSVYRAISMTTPNTRIIVDSSKLIYHFILLKTMAPHRVKLIHLVRDGRAVAKSMIKGNRMQSSSGTSSTAFAQAVRTWQRANFLMMILVRRIPQNDQYFLKYEDFCKDYCGKSKDLLNKMAQPMVSDEFVFSLKTHHNIGGSPSRFRFVPGEIKLDDTWRQIMTDQDRHLFARYGRRLNKRLGYNE